MAHGDVAFVGARHSGSGGRQGCPRALDSRAASGSARYAMARWPSPGDRLNGNVIPRLIPEERTVTLTTWILGSMAILRSCLTVSSSSCISCVLVLGRVGVAVGRGPFRAATLRITRVVPC